MSSIEGVNGFGNLPYAVKSTCILQVSQQKQQEAKFELWKNILV
jgi:hypothetical protein